VSGNSKSCFGPSRLAKTEQIQIEKQTLRKQFNEVCFIEKTL